MLMSIEGPGTDVQGGRRPSRFAVLPNREGMRTLYWDGIEKALKGLTTLDEVFRVAKRAESD